MNVITNSLKLPLLITCSIFAVSLSLAAGVLVEAESFDNHGGWVVDPQFVDTMGSPYLMAHGLGTPLPDATTTIHLPQSGEWRVWVRTRDWTPDFNGTKPGRFQLLINNTPLTPEFGTSPASWGWVDGGTVTTSQTMVELRLHDLTGFNGRCDAIWLTTDLTAPPPPNNGAELRLWRTAVLDESPNPPTTLNYDLVVVGGGFGGCGAALAAARSGLQVALVQDRPILGGNASQEIRVASRGEIRYKTVDEFDTFTLSNRSPDTVDRDAARMALFESEPNITLYMQCRAYDASTNTEHQISHVDVRHTVTGARTRLSAPLFVDSTGDGWIGYWAGADWRMGREARHEHNESLAPDNPDTETLGSSLMWRSYQSDSATTFPTNLPWATAVTGSAASTGGEWDWEYGINATLDTIQDAEHIRDHLLRAIFGNYANAKKNPDNANRVLEWVPYIAGKRESRRLLGPYILTQTDVLEGPYFEDAVVTTDWGIDLHMETSTSYRTTYKNYGNAKPCFIPYRTLFSRNIRNLFMAGRNFSTTHVALGSPRVMNTIGQMGVAVGFAAAICTEQQCLPADIYRYADKFSELRDRLTADTISSTPSWPANPWLFSSAIIDTRNKQLVTTIGEWLSSSYDNGKWGATYLHDNREGKGEKFVIFNPPTPLSGDYMVSTWHSLSAQRDTNVPLWLVTNYLAKVATAPNAYTRNDMPDTYRGSEEILAGRVSGDKFLRGFMRFNLSDIPQGAIIDNATLTLTIYRKDTESDNETAGSEGIVVQHLTAPFDPSAVTWNNRMANTPWETPGGDYTTNIIARIPNPPYFGNVAKGDKFTFNTEPALLDLIRTTATSTDNNYLHLILRTPSLETSYNSRKIYRFTDAQLDVSYIDVNRNPDIHINLMQNQAEWRPLMNVPVGDAGLRVVIGNRNTTNYVTADAIRVDLEHSDVNPNDYDGNGLPNWWERLWFMRETGTDPLADPDGDGSNNLEEFQRGTNPLDPSSLYRPGTQIKIR